VAREVILKHQSGLMRKGYIGFSWTSLLFGCFPAIFRGDWFGCLLYVGLSVLLAVLTLGIGNIVLMIVWAILYNKWHLKRLIEKGYRLADGSEASLSVKAELGME